MAKVLGTAVADAVRKRIGNIVFRQTDAGTVAAQRPSKMTNPRTVAQMSQRIRLANVVAFYRASRYWMPKGFELKERQESTYNAFVKANLASNPVALTKQEVANGACVVYPYKISKGSLPPITWVQSGDNHLSNIYIGDGGSVVTGTGYLNPNATIGELSALVLGNNLSIQAGDQLSVIAYQQSVDADGTPYVVATKYEILMDVTDGRLLGDYWPVTGYGVLVVVGGDSAQLSLGIATASASGFAMVVSRTEGATTRVSTQSLIVPDASNYSYYTSAAHVSEAAASYGENTEVFLDSNGIEAPVYNPIVQRAVLGITIGPDGSSSYWPVGSTLPDAIATDARVAVRVTDATGLVSTGNVIRLYGGQDGSNTQLRTLSADAITVSGNDLVFTAPAGLNYVTRVTVSYADDTRVVGNWQLQGTE